MGIGSRKIQKGDISKSTKANSIMKSNSSTFEGISGDWQNFIGESELEGKGWKSAKALASVFQTINQTFQMLSEQVSEANQKVITSQGILKNDQIDEQALKQRIEQNKQTMSQLSQAQTLWKRDNPDKSSSSFDNLNRSIGNENAVLQKEIDSLDTFDSATRSVYDNLNGTISKLSTLLAQVSKSSSVYDSKAGLFTTKNIHMKEVTRLSKLSQSYKISRLEKKSMSMKDYLIAILNYSPEEAQILADLFEKNPAAAIKKLKENPNIFSTIVEGLDVLTEKWQNILLVPFMLEEDLTVFGKNVTQKLFNKDIFVNMILSLEDDEDKYKMLEKLYKLQDKGWDILSPIGSITGILSKTTFASKAKELMATFLGKLGDSEKLKYLKEFMENPIMREAVGPIGDSATIGVTALDEYNNPTSKAHNDVKKSVQGAMFKWLLEAGPVEGAYLGGPGVAFGTLNTLLQGVEIKTPFGTIGYKFVTEKDKEEALKSYYEYLDAGGYAGVQEKRKELFDKYDIPESFSDKIYNNINGTTPNNTSGTPQYKPGG